MIKYPHKVMRIIIRYPANQFEEVFRLLPDEKRINLSSGEYFFEQTFLNKNKELLDKLVYKTNEKKIAFTHTGINKNGKEVKNEYYINENFLNKSKDVKMPTIEYWFGCPEPIEFNFEKNKVTITAKQLETYKKSDLISKLFRLNEEKMMFMLIIILVAINLLISFVIFAKLQEWIK
jgi:hypothetical protein